MRRLFLLSVIVAATAVSGDASDTPSKRQIPCKTASDASSCYWTHGRLSGYNGTPAFRLWKTGTHRLLRIYSGQGAERVDPLDNEHPEMPSSLMNVDLRKQRIFGDFEICPLRPEHTGVMQPACIESAKNIFIDAGE